MLPVSGLLPVSGAEQFIDSDANGFVSSSIAMHPEPGRCHIPG